VNSFSGDAFIKPGPAPSALFDAETDLPMFEEESLMVGSDTASGIYEAINEDMGFEDGDFYSGGNLDDTAESLLEQDPFEMTSSPQFGDDALLRSLRKELASADVAIPAVIRPHYQDDRKLDKIYGGSRALGEAHEQQKRFPVQVRVREVNIIWNLYDGYDWRRTREAITQAVEEVEMKLEERKSSRRRSNTFEDDAETVIGDCLFNSIYIGVPSAREPADLRHSISNLINQGNEAASETESYATTGISRPSQADLSRQKRLRKKRLRLQRGTSHKLGFELKGVSLDFLIHPAGSGEVQSSIDVRVTNFEIFDHVPTSTWKKFLTLHNDRKNMREMMKPMIHLELLNVRPVPELVATEMTIRVSRRASFTVPKADHILGFCSTTTPACRPRCTRVHDPLLRLQRRLVQTCRCYCRATVHTTAGD
jgi:autophagy-related protein 2